MAWIESHQSLSHHRKTLKAATLLRVDRVKLIGHLQCLWWWALDNVPSDGSLDGIDDGVIAAGAQWDGKTDFVAALREAGFIDEVGLHNWPLYGGKLQDRRETDRRRKAEVRKKSSGHPKEVSRRQEERREDKTTVEKIAPTEQEERARPFVLYEQALGQPVPNRIVADRLIFLEGEFGLECLEHCLEAAAIAEAYDIRYVEKILKRHQRDGCEDRPIANSAAPADLAFFEQRYAKAKGAAG